MTRIACGVAGVLLLVFAWAGPLPEKASVSFAAHMSLHMLVVALAAPLLAVAIAGASWDPVSHWPGLFPPILASVVEMVAVWAWHAPALHHFARDSTLGFIVEQACFLLSGLWLWLSAVGGRSAYGRASHASSLHALSLLALSPQSHQRRAAGVLALLLTSMHMTLLGALLAFAPRLLFAHESMHESVQHDRLGLAVNNEVDVEVEVEGQPTRQTAWNGATVTTHVIHSERMFQQQLGGAIMLVVGGAAYLIGGVALTRQLLPADGVHATEVKSA